MRVLQLTTHTPPRPIGRHKLLATCDLECDAGIVATGLSIAIEADTGRRLVWSRRHSRRSTIEFTPDAEEEILRRVDLAIRHRASVAA